MSHWLPVQSLCKCKVRQLNEIKIVSNSQDLRLNTMNCSDKIILVTDNLIALLVIGPLVATYWRGTWGLLDTYMCPDHPRMSIWICVILGNMGWFTLTMLQDKLINMVSTDHWWPWFPVCHLYIYVGGIMSVFHWRGMWKALDEYTGYADYTFLASLLTGLYNPLVQILVHDPSKLCKLEGPMHIKSWACSLPIELLFSQARFFCGYYAAAF